jgi:dihydrofolate reductase/thymidylate synthase
MPLKKCASNPALTSSQINNSEFNGTFNLVVAYSFDKQGIGFQGTIPWHIPEDMAHFKEITTSNTSEHTTKFDLYNIVVMGRKTWESIPAKFKPLERRFNVILSNNLEYITKMNAEYDPSLSGYCNVLFTTWNNLFLEGGYIQLQENIKALCEINYNKFQYFIIGGAQIYNLALLSGNPLVINSTEIYNKSLECDTFFPKIDKVNIHNISNFQQSKKNDRESIWYRFITYTRPNMICFNKNIPFYRTPVQSSVGIKEELEFLSLMRQILETGKSNNDRTGVGTLSIFGAMLKYDLRDTFPISTTKRIPLRMVFEELMLYLSGKTDNRILQEKGIHIWDGNTTRAFLDSRGLCEYREGDFGETYGFNFRHYGASYLGCETVYPLPTKGDMGYGFDQLGYVINLIKTDPYSRRMIIDLWNPATQHKAALPPCLCKYQFNVDVEQKQLNLAIYLRSSDYFLANNWNTCTGALLVHLICNLEGIDLTPGELTVFMADAHIYKSHIEQVRENLSRVPYPYPKLVVKLEEDTQDTQDTPGTPGTPDNEEGKQKKEQKKEQKKKQKKKDIMDFRWEDIELLGYKSHPSIKAEMAV